MSSFGARLTAVRDGSKAMTEFGSNSDEELVLSDEGILNLSDREDNVKEETPKVVSINKDIVIQEEALKPKPEKSNTTSYINPGLVEYEKKINAADGFGFSSTLKSLSLSADDVKSLKIVHLKKTDVVPLPGFDTKDSDGRISNIIASYEKKFNLHVIPCDITKVSDWVEPLNHGRFEWNGRKYFYPLDNENSNELVKEFVMDCKRKLEECKEVVENLFVSFERDGIEDKTLRFTQEELADIATYLSNYSAKIIEIGNKDLILLAGDYVYE